MKIMPLYLYFAVITLCLPCRRSFFNNREIEGEFLWSTLKNATFVKLRSVNDSEFAGMISPMFTTDEQIIQSFKGIRDGVVFTNKWIITINIQGITGKKKDSTTLPYSKIQAYSVETAGTFDLDSELDLWFSGMGRIRFEFVARADVTGICRMISEKVL